MRLSVSSSLPRQWPLLGLAALLLALAAALAMALAGTGPASAQDSSDPPAKPADLSITTEQGSLDVALDWDDGDGADRYLVRWRSVDSGEKLNDGIEVATSHAAITVADYGDWVVRVQACNDAGCGEPQAERFTVEPDPESTPEPTPEPGSTPAPEPTPEPAPTAIPVPAQPSGLRVAAEPGLLNVNLDWDDVYGAPEYWLRWRSVDNGEKLSKGVRIPTSETTLAMQDYGTWVVRVQACNDSGCGEPLAKEFTVEPEPSVPDKPANLSVRATPGQFDMSATWDALDGATSYNLAWKPVREDFEPANTATVTSNSADFTVSGYGQWTVRLEGCNDAGCGPSVYYGTGVAPGGPANLAVSAAPGQLDLSATWDALDGATLYKLSWRQSDGDFEEGNAIWVSTAGATITVEDYSQWVVRLEGCNDAGCGPPVSQQVEVEPTPAPIDLRLGPSLNDEDQSRPRSFTASWDPVPDASSYTLRWQRDGAEPEDREPADRRRWANQRRLHRV